MSAATDTKQDRINLRLKRSTKQVLERAASFEGKTVSKFILTSALARAEETIHEHELMSLNARDSEAFFNFLMAHYDAGDPVGSLRRAMPSCKTSASRASCSVMSRTRRSPHP
jgi:uncharacterized protein (DUF1778 family)